MAPPNSRHQLLLSAMEKYDLSNALCRSVVMKRSARFDRRIRPRNDAVGRKVRTLQKLIPNCDQSVGVERLFSETAEYIVALQMRVKVMQIMVDALSGCNDDE